MADVQSNRYIRVRCPFCDEVSPTIDQQEDIRREGLWKWWDPHAQSHVGGLIIERRYGLDA